jgi:hypothetical protein
MRNINQRAYEMGQMACANRIPSSPCLNKDLMSWIVGEYNSWDDKKFKEKIKIYKSYTKGWTDQNHK